jgi:hypothetical protein
MSKKKQPLPPVEVPVEVVPVETLPPAPAPPAPVTVQHRWSASGPRVLGLKCPRCHCVAISDGKCVRDTDRIPDAIRRYRVCRNCGRVWTTIER